jgi:hypothetical protein
MIWSDLLRSGFTLFVVHWRGKSSLYFDDSERDVFYLFILVILLDRIVRSFQRTSNSTIVKAQTKTKTQFTFLDVMQRLTGWLCYVAHFIISPIHVKWWSVSTLDPTVAAAILAIFIFIMQNKNTFLSTLLVN